MDVCINTLREGTLLTEQQVVGWPELRAATASLAPAVRPRVGPAQVQYVCQGVIDVLLKEPNIRPVASPVTVVGDIHGCASRSGWRAGSGHWLAGARS